MTISETDLVKLCSSLRDHSAAANRVAELPTIPHGTSRGGWQNLANDTKQAADEIERLTVALQVQRKMVIEECAKVCDAIAIGYAKESNNQASIACNLLSANLRSLPASLSLDDMVERGARTLYACEAQRCEKTDAVTGALKSTMEPFEEFADDVWRHDARAVITALLGL